MRAIDVLTNLGAALQVGQPSDLVSLQWIIITALAGVIVSGFWFFQKQLKECREETLKTLRECSLDKDKLYQVTHDGAMAMVRQADATVTALKGVESRMDLLGVIEKAVEERDKGK